MQHPIVFVVVLGAYLVIFGALILFAMIRDARRKKHRLAQAKRQATQDRYDRIVNGWQLASRPRPTPTVITKRPSGSTQRKPRNPNLPRYSCPVCDHSITLNKDGSLRMHGTGMSSCGGSGRKLFDFLIRENPYS